MSIYRIFKKIPPDNLILKFYSIVGVESFDNSMWFSKGIFDTSRRKQFDELLFELEPYYMEHKAFVIKREMNANRYIQILRHLAKAKGIYLEGKAYGKQKGTYYRLHVLQNVESDFCLRFD